MKAKEKIVCQDKTENGNGLWYTPFAIEYLIGPKLCD
jgi:hypothetical protein